jgi:hypothetical protein
MLVAGDICLDVVGVPALPPSVTVDPIDNWRLTGETRTHYLLGGAMLVARLIRAALPKTTDVRETRVCRPTALSGKETNGDLGDQPLTPDEFLEIAERLTREEIVHSLLSLDYVRQSPDSKDSGTLRVQTQFGYSGPRAGDPSLKLIPPDEKGVAPDFVVLDDTGNRFRRIPEQWPAAITDPRDDGKTVVVHKLHRPLPARLTQPAGSAQSSLWETVARHDRNRRIVIVSVDDLRDEDALISRGLSWERTALDLVWQLLNRPAFAALRDCPHLIVRLGLDGAVYWQHKGESVHCAWLIYDPSGIEGTGASAVEGEMVGYGSAFTAAVVKHLADHRARNPEGESLDFLALQTGAKLGLMAARRLLRLGYGNRSALQPNYPAEELFGPSTKDDAFFACQPIPIIPQAAEPDRGYWRLLDTILQQKTALLHRAVALTATGAKPTSPEDKQAAELLKQVPTAVFAKALRTCDRREIENYRSLYTLMLDYIRRPSAPRPLSVAVFGPPGAGKSFGIKMVAKALSQLGNSRPIETLTFNLSQYQAPDQLADAFHLVRDLALRGRIPLVFFDEFDTSLGGSRLGWLRYFLAPMQDAEFLDRGTPHPIGQAIFVFAGGTSGTYTQFAEPFLNQNSKSKAEFHAAKGPDFLSRLRGTLDIPGLDLNVPFDPFGPVDAFPCEAAILLRRAGILAFQLSEKAPQLRDAGNTLRVSPVVLRALLHLPQFEHGNRSFEALLDMSHLPGALKFTPALLPSPLHAELHAAPLEFSQLLATEYPFSTAERELIAQAIHASYRGKRLSEAGTDGSEPSVQDWAKLPENLKESNRQQADHIAVKLRAAGLWFRKTVPGRSATASFQQRLAPLVESLAKSEHDRWVVEKRRQGWIAAADKNRASRDEHLLLHNFLFPWDELSNDEKDLDRNPVLEIPNFLAAAGYEILKP